MLRIARLIIVGMLAMGQGSPVVILTAGELAPPPPGQPMIPDAQVRSVLDQFRRDHDEMAALSTRGVNLVVDGSSHYIQQIKPQVVIDSIDEVVDQARADLAQSRND